MQRPITPDEATIQQGVAIPDTVIKVFNEAIVENLVDGEAVVKQDEVVARLVDQEGFLRRDIFLRGYLNVEGIFKQAGWDVRYEKKSYTDVNNSSLFIFTASR